MSKKEPRTFSGIVDANGRMEDPSTWLKHYLRTCRINDWADDGDKLLNVCLYLTHEAEVWYDVNSAWVEHNDRTWAQFEVRFLARFRPANYEQMIQEELLKPKQQEGEGVRAYADRYERLRATVEGGPTLNELRTFWISGLLPHLKKDVRMAAPVQFEDAVRRAERIEQVNLMGEIEDGPSRQEEGVSASKVKSLATNLNAAEEMAKIAAGKPLQDKVPIKTGTTTIDPEDFKEFQKDMGTEITDVAMDELIKRYSAWQLFTQVYRDPATVKAEIIKKFRVTTERKPTSGGISSSSSSSACSFCKKAGHSYRECDELKSRRDKAGRPGASSSTRENVECWHCFQKGHYSTDCPKKAESSTSRDKKKVSSKKATAKKRKPKKEESSDEEDEGVLYSYAAKKVPIKVFMAKRKKDSEPSVEVEAGPSSKGKKKKTAKRNPAAKTPDPDLVAFVRKWEIPLELTARHGAMLGTQTKRAIQAVYQMGKDYRKAKHPVVAPGHLSHAMVVVGRLGSVKCEKLVIDPGSTTTILDIQKAREAGIGIKKGSKYLIQLANGDLEAPFGETAAKETITVKGVEAKLRMPVMDSKGSYDILLGRDWLHAVNAVGQYRKNEYSISNKGMEAVLVGKEFTTKEVELSSEEETDEDSDDESSSSDEDDEEEEDEEEGEETLLAQSFRAQCLRLDDFDLKVVGARHQDDSVPVIKSLVLEVDQLEELDLSPDLTGTQREQAKALLWEFRDHFASTLEELGNTDVVEHEINLKPGAKPFYCPGIKRFSPKELEFIRADVEKELSAGKIIEYDGPWCAPITLAMKKEGTYRKCVAYNGLNDRTERESWPLPNIEELLDRLAGHEWYSALDGFVGYYTVKVREEDIPKTTFRTPFGTYAYTVMPFGLKNAPHTFSRLTYKTFAHLIGKTIEAYIDDTATFSDSFEDHLQHLRKTLEAMRKSNLKLKAAKCHFFYRKVEFVGHLVSKEGIEMMPGKVKRVMDWPTPTDRTTLKGFLGLAGYYRRFVKDFAQTALALNRLTSKTVPFKWGTEQKEAFEAMKIALTSAPVLCKPRFDDDWTLEVDASDSALGAVLGQEQEDAEVHPVYFWSRQLSKAEKNYSVTDRECLAIVAACKKLRPYVLGRFITIVGDHTAVKWLMNKVDLTGRHARWQVILSEFDYKIETRPGSKNGNADALSRIPGQDVSAVDVDDEPAHFGLLASLVHQMWVTSPWYKEIYVFLETLVALGDTSSERERIRKKSKRFTLRGSNLLYLDSDGELKLCLVQEDLKRILYEYHDGATGGHFGRDITIARIRQKFWWPSIWKDVADYVKTCDTCQRYGPQMHHNPLQPYRPVYPFEIIFLDFIVNLPGTPRKNRHIITMTEGLTKWCEAKAMKDATAANAAKFLFHDVVHRFGVPHTVITDNGSHFKGEFHALCVKLGINHRFATAYHPQTAGQDERTNGLLLGRIRKWRLAEYNKWDEDLPASVFACNTRPISSTSFSAMQSLMGYTAGTASERKIMRLTKNELRKRIALVCGGIDQDIVTSRVRLLESLRDEAVRIKDIKATKMKARYDKRVRAQKFCVGDLVLHFDSSLLKQWSRKLDERWLGPFRVVWQGTQGAYSILNGSGGTKLVSGDQLKRYQVRK